MECVRAEGKTPRFVLGFEIVEAHTACLSGDNFFISTCEGHSRNDLYLSVSKALLSRDKSLVNVICLKGLKVDSVPEVSVQSVHVDLHHRVYI